MRILVFSDSHGNTACMDKAIAAVSDFDAIIHLGDIERDVRRLEQKYSEYPIYAVCGNNDFSCQRPTETVVTLGGVSMLLCHGHTRGVRRGCTDLVRAAKARGCTAALFGHTHRPVDTVEDQIAVYNPGSCSLPREGAPTFGVLEIENGKCGFVIVDWIL